MAQQAVSGLSSVVDGTSQARAWRIKMNELAAEYVASGMQKGMGRIAGVKRWGGVYVAYGGTPAVFPSATFTFTGNTDESVGYTGTARCERIRIEWDPDAHPPVPIRHMVFFRSAGALTPGAAPATDATTPAREAATSLRIDLIGTQQTHVHKAQLDIFAKHMKRYADTSTSFWEYWTEGAIDAEAWWDVWEDAPGSLPTLQTEHTFKIYTTATEFWELQWMRIVGHDPFEVDHEGNRPAGARVRAQWNSDNGTSVGTIKNPATTVKWP
ncbi:MAG: hypothetical protein ACYTEX_22825 [Planctomycetota bacterium]|jgi:hypothetical protein